MWVKFKQPKWAKRLELRMANLEQKIAELEASNAAKAAAINASIDGVVTDLKAQSDEITALKQAIIDAGTSTPGEIPQELADRIDALKGSFDTVIQRLADVDAALPAPAPAPVEPPAAPTE